MANITGFVSPAFQRLPMSRAAMNRCVAPRTRWMATAAEASPARRLRELTTETRRGTEAPPDKRSAVLELVKSLESDGWKGPGDGPLSTEDGRKLLNGPWELVFEMPKEDKGADPGTAQQATIAVTDGPVGKRGQVMQNIDIQSSRIENKAETNWGTFRVEATYMPIGDSELDVTFDKAHFKVGPFPEFEIPISWLGGGGTLNTTYLDENVRISRGNKGTLFCLVRPDAGQHDQTS